MAGVADGKSGFAEDDDMVLSQDDVGSDEDSNGDSIPVHVEVLMHPQSSTPAPAVRERVLALLKDQASFAEGHIDYSYDKQLSTHVLSIRVVDLDTTKHDGDRVSFWQADFRIHVYHLSHDGASEEHTDDSADAVAACEQWVLPAVEFDGLWESLVLDHNIKAGLLEYAATAMLFADAHVNQKIVSCNRVVLLHGPPGTGKTSLCKALAHKLAIRFDDRYSTAALLEINAHSLFSKWFSESGKLVMKLFAHIQELVDDSDALVCVLIDEVESLTAARKAAVSGTEPSDAVRVVNALLTQIDKLSRCSNVLILTTSNITEAIDIAFVDRADIKQFIGLPGVEARYDILKSCVLELMACGIVATEDLPPFKLGGASVHPTAASTTGAGGAGAGGGASKSGRGSQSLLHTLLVSAATKAEGLSGRALRKLPFQAHAYFVQARKCSAVVFLKGLVKGVERELSMRAELTHG